MNNPDNVLLVKSGASFLGVEIKYIREISSDVEVFPLPVKLPDISHLSVLRGVPQALLNAEYFFSIEHTVRDKLLFMIGNIALFIDEAVQTIQPGQLANSSTPSASDSRFIKSVFQFRNKTVPVIDVPEILNDKPETKLITI